jgi:hypothetical protein
VASQHVVEAQLILSELFTRGAQAPGLLKAAVESDVLVAQHR